MKKNIIINVLLVIFVLIFFVSGFFLARYFLNSRKSQKNFGALADMVEQAQPAPVPSGESAEQEPQLPETVTVVNPRTGEEMQVLRQYAEVYGKNSDMIGWMKLEGTKINYPVMQTPDRKDFYLKKDFEKNYSAHGCFYVQENGDVFSPSDNLTIYGHNMKDGTMMQPLHNYKKKDFWQAHPTIQFDTLLQQHEYEVFAVFVTSATQGEGFAYNAFVDAADASEFDAYVRTCKELSFYDTGITPQFGDKLITLSTCDYTVSNGRLAVVARRVPNS